MWVRSINSLFLISSILCGGAWALESPFPSTVKGISIKNAHVVRTNDSGKATVLRGMEPSDKQMDELAEFGIKRILFFKNLSYQKAIEQFESESAKAAEHGMEIKKIEMPWKNTDEHRPMDDFSYVCNMTVNALAYLKKAMDEDEPVFFHCTVGEDRTGYLGALFRMAFEGWPVKKAFHAEMCLYGYGAGNKGKATGDVFNRVVKPMREKFTPQFLKMAALIDSGKLKWADLEWKEPTAEDEVPKFSVCESDPFERRSVRRKYSGKFECKTSPLYPKRRSSSR